MSDWVLIILSVIGGVAIGIRLILWLLNKAVQDAVGRKMW